MVKNMADNNYALRWRSEKPLVNGLPRGWGIQGQHHMDVVYGSLGVGEDGKRIPYHELKPAVKPVNFKRVREFDETGRYVRGSGKEIKL